MRTLVIGFAALGAALAMGCGDDSRPPGDSGTTRIDSGPGIDSGPRPDTGPLPDTGPRPDTGGMTGMCPAGMCDLLTNGCPAGQACYFLAPAMGEPAVPTCDMSGTGGDGATCTSYRDCQEGFFCDSTAGICRHYCCMDSDTGCPTGQTCAVSFVDDMGNPTGIGYCAFPDNCDPAAQTGCMVAGQGCYAQGMDGSTICIAPTMMLTEGQTCESLNACSPGFTCVDTGTGAKCHKYCNATDMTGCAMEQTCSSLSLPAPVDHVGICTPVMGG